MRRTIGLLVLMALVFCAAADASSTSIDPMRLGIGARSLAMGRTNAAAPGDINSLFINPANAAYLNSFGITSMYTSLLEGEINYTMLGGAGTFFGGGAGLAYLGGTSTGIQSTTMDANSRVAAAGNSFDYTNSTIALAYGKEIRPNLSIGAMLKAFSKGFSGFSSGTGFDADLGLLFKPNDALNLGLAFQNVLPEGMGGIGWGSGAREDVALNIKSGLKYNLRDNFLLNADVDLMPFALHSGMEWWLTPIFALRAGVEQIPSGSSSQVMNMGAGAGIRLNGLNFDYAYLNDGSLAANSTHFFTLSYLPMLASREIIPAKKATPEASTILAPPPEKPKTTIKAKAKPVAKKKAQKKK